MDSKLFNLEEFELITNRYGDLNRSEKFSFILASIIRSILYIHPYDLGVRLKDPKRRDENISLTTLGNIIGFNSVEMIKLLAYHEDQYRMYQKRKNAIGRILVFLLIISLVVIQFSYWEEYRLVIASGVLGLSSLPYFILAYGVFLMFLYGTRRIIR